MSLKTSYRGEGKLDEQLLVQLHLIELKFNSIRRTFHLNLEPCVTQNKINLQAVCKPVT